MSRMSFFDDFIGHNGTASLFDRMSIFHPTTNDAGVSPTHEFGIISENGISAGRILTAGALGMYAGLYLEVPQTQAKRHPVFGGCLMFRDVVAITDQIVLFGFRLPDNSDVYAFYLDTGVSPNWEWLHITGGSQQRAYTDFIAKQKFWYALEVSLSPKETLYTMNGKVVQRIKRDASTQTLDWLVATQTSTSAPKEMIIDYLYGEHDR